MKQAPRLRSHHSVPHHFAFAPQLNPVGDFRSPIVSSLVVLQPHIDACAVSSQAFDGGEAADVFGGFF